MAEVQKKTWVKWGIALSLGIIFAFLLEGIISSYQICRGYGEGGTMVSLTPMMGNDYVVGEKEENGKFWLVTGPDPWMLIHPDREIGHIYIRFGEPLAEEMEIQCFYAVNDGFHALQRKNTCLLKGTREAVLTIPYGTWNSYRLGITGSFVLDKIEGAEAVPLSAIHFGQIIRQADGIRLLFFCLLFCISGVLFIGQRERKKAAEAVRKTGRQRVVFLDAIRVLASLMVIITHVAGPMERMFALQERMSVYLAFLFCQFVTMSCNPLFFMLSGALLLPWREESFSVFVQKRLIKVVLPLFVYGGIYLVFFCASRVSLKEWAAACVLAMLQGNVRMGPHLWMVFELIGMYILVPLFRALLKNASEQTEKLLAVFILILTGISSTAYFVQIELGVSTFLSGWTGAFLMGYLMNRDWMRRYDRLWISGGVAALVLGIFLSAKQGSHSNYIFGASVLEQLIACGIFSAVLHLEKYLQRIKKVLLFFSNYSYSVLLIHWYVLYNIVFIQGLSPSMPKVLFLLAAVTACTLLSFVFSVLIDHTVIAVLEQGIGRLSGWIHTSRFFPYYKYRE